MSEPSTVALATIKPTAVIGDAVLYLADCRDVLPLLGNFEAVLTDPPYGIGGYVAHPSNYRRMQGARGEAWDNKPFEDLEAVLAKAPVQCVWGGNHYALPLSRGWLAWHKPDAPPSMANVELAWTNQDRNARHFSQSIAATNAERAGHPTQKPLALMLWCIAQLARPRSILDPFMGTGTTGVAASMLGCRFTGIEINERYFEIACKRIEDAQRQAPLMIDRMWLDECMPAYTGCMPLPFDEGDQA